MKQILNIRIKLEELSNKDIINPNYELNKTINFLVSNTMLNYLIVD